MTVRIIGADIPQYSEEYPVVELLTAFTELAAEDPSLRLALAGKRDQREHFSVWNYLDEHGLVEQVDYLPYYDRCTRFPYKKADCDAWVSRHTPAGRMTPGHLRGLLDGDRKDTVRYALFYTCFHPGKQEGNSMLMRMWIDHLKRAGYKVHLVYYMYDIDMVDPVLRRQAHREHDLYVEVAADSALTGHNRNGLNVHTDDWCGPEALEAIERLTSRFEYDVAITNYSFNTAVFERVAAYTRKVLLTHDSFSDRNRRMIEQGYGESGWMSLDERGERLACERSDVIVALQEEEAGWFRSLADDPDKVTVISPLMEDHEIAHHSPTGKLRIGYFGSRNWINERNLTEYLQYWAADDTLRQNSEIVIAGGVCDHLDDFMPPALEKAVSPRLLGRVDDLADFFREVDIVINPERGGTGIKIKTLEAMSWGMPVVCTRGGSVGLDSEDRYHLAQDFEELARLTAVIAADPSEVAHIKASTDEVYSRYRSIHRGKLGQLLGEARETPAAIGENIAQRSNYRPPEELAIPEYVAATAADYHIDEFKHFIGRTDIRGKRVLEIGSDYHLATSRLFMANGAAEVVATNIGDWRSDEPMPEGVSFIVGDVADADLEENSFDIIYGIAILEHIPDLDSVCRSISRFLKPDGVAYLQGCPIWVGSYGHHVWYTPDSSVDVEENFAKGGGKKEKVMAYSFADPECNPIPPWSHLVLTPDELEAKLVEDGVPADDAQGITHYIYNLDGTMAGSCSNFAAASDIIDALSRHFDIQYERVTTGDEPNEYYERARERYGVDDLATIGLNVWMRQKRALMETADAEREPSVSVVIPFYNVEAYIGDCLESVLRQDYANLEIVLVDDCSPDGSRDIVERYRQRDGRIRLITHDSNMGLGPARNTGVAFAGGDYLLFLDSDDTFACDHAVSALVADARRTGCKVVVGSCRLRYPDGRVKDFDRDFERRLGSSPGIIDADRAYLGASFIPGGDYVPMRAWGSLIEHRHYLDHGMAYPPTEHEDLANTPFLYYSAGEVSYIEDIIIDYQVRNESISNTAWKQDRVRRYAELWRYIDDNIELLGLQRYRCDTAVKTAEHMLLKLRQNGLQADAIDDAIETLGRILEAARGRLNRELFHYFMDGLNAFFAQTGIDQARYRRVTGCIDIDELMAYYRSRMQDDRPPLPAVPIHS